jgi:hypothetical protein
MQAEETITGHAPGSAYPAISPPSNSPTTAWRPKDHFIRPAHASRDVRIISSERAASALSMGHSPASPPPAFSTGKLRLDDMESNDHFPVWKMSRLK